VSFTLCRSKGMRLIAVGMEVERVKFFQDLYASGTGPIDGEGMATCPQLYVLLPCY
jgi:hypothetical protein